MKNKYFSHLFLFFGLTICHGASAETEYTVKRGAHPYMAFIYYSDSSIVDNFGHRFVRSAILIRPDWLVTTALGPSFMDVLKGYGFPKKTLLARAGAVTIDTQFSLNVDEEEQEREIVQIIRPYNHSATQWWTTDISLMKTLLPFNMTSAVAFKSLHIKDNKVVNAKVCSILVYAKRYGNLTEDKNLLMLYVDMQQPSLSNCGEYFNADTMACAVDSKENKDSEYDPNFCQGNSGGPLICDSEVVGLQTYIDDDCSEPHLYQLLYYWDKFITCGIEDKCQEENCASICDVVYKDRPIDKVLTSSITYIIDDYTIPSTEITEATSKSTTNLIPTLTSGSTTTEPPNLSVSEETMPVFITELTSTTKMEPTMPKTTVTIIDITNSSTLLTKEEAELLNSIENVIGLQEKDDRRSWPNLQDEFPKHNSTLDVDSKRTFEKDRKAMFEAKRLPKKSYSGTAGLNMFVLQTVIYGLIAVLCL